MRPWVLGAWILLTLGITAGSYWAYYELGWGGWWFWDPVENASLMPWLAATALLHSINVLAARGALKAWTMMLAVLAFSMSMVGTFLVRSGVLTSVHAFAIDPGARHVPARACSRSMSARRSSCSRSAAPRLSEGAPFELVSRESGLVINNLLLTVILGIVFVGTLYPLFVEAVTGEKLSVGAPYFNAVAGPLALLLAVLVGIGPLLSWRRERRPVLKRLTVPALLGATALGDHVHSRARHRASCRGSGSRSPPSSPPRRSAADRCATPCGRRSRPGAWWSPTSESRSRSPAWRRTAPSRARRLAVAKPGEQLTVGPWPVAVRRRDADRRQELDGDRGRAARVAR